MSNIHAALCMAVSVPSKKTACVAQAQVSGLRTEPLGPAVPCWAATLRLAPPHLLTLLRRWMRRCFLVQAALALGRQPMHPEQRKRQRSGALGSCCASRCLRSACGWSTRANPCYSAYGFPTKYTHASFCIWSWGSRCSRSACGLPSRADPCPSAWTCVPANIRLAATLLNLCSWHQGTAAPAWLCREQSCQRSALHGTMSLRLQSVSNGCMPQRRKHLWQQKPSGCLPGKGVCRSPEASLAVCWSAGLCR